MKIEKIRGCEGEINALEIKFSRLIVSRVNMTEIAGRHAEFVEHVDKFAHNKVAPNRRKVEENDDRQPLAALFLALTL